MDLTSLYYFSELAKDLHMTRTANRLFISQQTLSNHIQRLEEHFGTPLLHRKPKLALTYAGEHVLKFAEIVNREHLNLTDVLNDIEQHDRGVINFGASSMRTNSCLPQILPEFTRQYPNVELRLTDAISSKLEPMVLDGKLDFAIVLSGELNAKLIRHHLLDDQVYLCVTDSLLRQYYGDKAAALKEKAIHGANVTDFANLPLCMYSNRLGHKLMEYFSEGNVTPNIYILSEDTRIATSMCFQGVAACFATHMRLINRQFEIPADINIFPIYHHGEPLYQELSLIRHKDRYLSHFSKRFLELLLRHFNELERFCVERKV